MLLPPIATAVALACAVQSTAPTQAPDSTTEAPPKDAAVTTDWNVAGSWSGAISVPGQKLEFQLDLSEDGEGVWSGAVSIPSQGAVDLQLSGVAVEGNTVRFAITEIPGEPSFEGTIQGDTVAGQFTQNGMSFPFSMNRAGVDAARAGQALEGIGDIIDAALAAHHVPSVGVCVVYKGEVILADGFGHRHLEGQLEATGDTLYSIGSSTKAFTAFAMATLVSEGKLEWDTLVKDVLPSFDLADEYAEDHMTVQDLLTHRSGLPRHDLVWYSSPDATRPELLSAMEHMEPNARLGERFQYQNFMYMTAGMVVEAISGESWESFISQKVLEPLEMPTTNFLVPTSDVDLTAVDAALPYAWDGDQFELDDFYNITAMGPAGSIRSSANEMGHWLQLLLAGGEYGESTLLPEDELRYLMSSHSSLGAFPTETNQVMVGYGLGWFLESYKGHYLAQHGGNINGFSAMVALFPLDDLGIAVFANANSTSLPDKLTRVLADRVLMLETDDWLAAPKSDEDEEDDQEGDEDSEETGRVLGTKPARAMAAYAGEYAHPAYGSVTVTVNADEDGLTVTVGEEKWELAHWHYEVFRAAGEDPPVSLDDVDLHFRANAQGRIVALEAQLEPSVDPISFERQPDQALLTPERLDRLVGSYKVNAQITLKITRRAQTLMVSQNGGPSLTLVPVEGTRFEIEEMAGFALEFELPASGPAPSMRAFEPGGSTVCERIEP